MPEPSQCFFTSFRYVAPLETSAIVIVSMRKTAKRKYKGNVLHSHTSKTLAVSENEVGFTSVFLSSSTPFSPVNATSQIEL